MNVNYKEYDFSLNGSEIRIIKKALYLAMSLSCSDIDEDKRNDYVAQLCELFNDQSGNCSDAYICVSNFSNML